MPATVIVAGISLARPEHGRFVVEGELDGRPEEAQEGQRQPLEHEEPQGRSQEQVGQPNYKEPLDKQDERIRELESQVAVAGWA